MVQNGPKHLTIVNNSPKQSKNGLKQLKMDENSPKRLKTVQNVQKWNKYSLN